MRTGSARPLLRRTDLIDGGLFNPGFLGPCAQGASDSSDSSGGRGLALTAFGRCPFRWGLSGGGLVSWAGHRPDSSGAMGPPAFLNVSFPRGVPMGGSSAG